MRNLRLKDHTITNDIITDELKNILTKDFVITLEIFKRFVWAHKTPTQLIDSENNNEIKCAFDTNIHCTTDCAAFETVISAGCPTKGNCQRGNFTIGLIPKDREKDD